MQELIRQLADRAFAPTLMAAALAVLAPSAAQAAARCQNANAVEGEEIHCFLKAADGLKQTITVNSPFATEVLFEQTSWIGPCRKPATRTSTVTRAFRGESKALLIPVNFKTGFECAEVAFTSCQAAEPGGSPEVVKMKRFDCPAALEVTP